MLPEPIYVSGSRFYRDGRRAIDHFRILFYEGAHFNVELESLPLSTRFIELVKASPSNS